ncbi:membrane protein insertion efficiency factor YidD [Streptomyces sp. NPDC127068]|uniref:membrane protein insertion efficiency factor YidD n=1 Tax=Streptomyces sp. NPDC127068 TaxID=3347127 RepID=UPI00365B01FA
MDERREEHGRHQRRRGKDRASGRYRSRRDGPPEEEKDGCCMTAMDTYVGHYYCCPANWFPVLVLLALRPGSTKGTTGRRAHRTDPAARRPSGPVAGVLYAAVVRYRTEVSPRLPARCPYRPSCSTYAVQALGRHGAVRGVRLTVGRLLRCRPSRARRRGAIDPVPPVD